MNYFRPVPQKVIISVISDLVTDQRVQRSAMALMEEGFDVILVGRCLPDSKVMPERPYAVRRFRLLFYKGPLFYLNYNIRLFFYLLFSKVDILFSNDLDTLPANYLISKLKGKPVLYDSHEYFTGVPELVERPMVRNIWKWLEKKMIPGVAQMFTVNESIASLYKTEYSVNVLVMRNVPVYEEWALLDKSQLRRELGLPVAQHLYILQGSGINIQRGAEEAVEAMQYLPNGILLIVGGGDVIDELKRRVKKLNLERNVIFKPKMDMSELRKITKAADVGLTLDKDLSINYRFSLPNKLFDYIHAGIPILASDLPEVKKIIQQYQVGLITPNHDPKQLALLMQQMTSDKVQMEKWKLNASAAAKELNWQKEKMVLVEVFRQFKS